MSDNDSSDCDERPVRCISGQATKRLCHKKQKFREDWTRMECFKKWLNPVKEDVMKAYCSFCKIQMISELSTIKKHANTSRHKLNFKSMTGSKSIISTFPKIDETAIRKNNAVKVAEIKLCGFLSEHNISFLAVDHLSQLLKECFSLVEVFKNSESANEGATAQKLYTEVIKSFKDEKVCLKNVIGFASDGCNTMMGAWNSVASRFLEDFPGVMIQKCICHSLALCASEACKVLPRRCEDLARDVYNFFKSSCKRYAQLKEFQDFCTVEPHHLLRPCQTRWLSLEMVVCRILEQWQPLKMYFTLHRFDERVTSGEHIYN
ncbi:uncharacterized protein LOC103311373 [Acyrthosiphon pisum]|uniref:DUF4371 domain-containing protein n=1 Tax=Acyrthosiphon pisum TaxID=7029 RepID=A0A8R2BB01_ACYPI|nr:uncharacterized protein LOC103311373 [Acyrthosiphon pisum]|eukprot:XP_008189191.1 PREDICTED: uncharacterized protein LOC103311373 [Acyrthosiphon pisum]